jgi:NAD(P) transhydrogenase subunit beta
VSRDDQDARLVAFMHSMIGLVAVFIAVAAVAEPHAFNIVAKGLPIPRATG